MPIPNLCSVRDQLPRNLRVSSISSSNSDHNSPGQTLNSARLYTNSNVMGQSGSSEEAHEVSAGKSSVRYVMIAAYRNRGVQP